MCADFHRLPLADRSCDLIVAAFCLYHSPAPASVIAEIARCLTDKGTAVIAVKSADRYRELDRLMAAAGLDPAAESRPSLYQAAHSGCARRRARGAPARSAGHGDIRRHLPGRRAEAGHAPVSGHFVKRYASAPARNRAEANYRWLTRLQGPAHLPELRHSGERELYFQHVEGRHAVPADLTMLAARLGDIHGAVHRAELRKAELPRPYRAAGGQVLSSFPVGRLAAVERELAAGHVPNPRLTISQACRLRHASVDTAI